MRNAATVVAGNEYLAERAQEAGASSIGIIPTVIDLDRYPDQMPGETDKSFTIGWIGSPSTARYVEDITPSLRKICDERDAHVKLIGSGNIDLEGVNLEVREWSEETEIQDIQDIDVGIMPLAQHPWERGKCGFKLIQYMGCWKPVAASPVGMNQKIVENGVNGYLADEYDAWVKALRTLLDDEERRNEMGRRGRQRVEQEYCLKVTTPRWRDVIHRVARGG
jgi:glycosyltransferase involved in cell wall biosynthesis